MAGEAQAPTYSPVDVSDMSMADQPPTYMPGEYFSTTVVETAAPMTLETAAPTSSELSDPTTMPESPSTALPTLPPTSSSTTEPPTTQAVTRGPYTFPPFRRRTTTPASAFGSEDAATSEIVPEFGTRITHRKPTRASSGDGSRRRRPGARRRPAGRAGSGSGSRRRPVVRRRPVGGRRSTTPLPYTTTPAPVEVATMPPVMEMADEVIDQQVEMEQQMDVIPGDDQRGEMEGVIAEEQNLQEVTEYSEAMPETVGPIEDDEGYGQLEISAGVMPMEEAALMPEQTPAAEMPADEMITAEVMPEEMDSVVTATEEVEPAEIMQEETVPVEIPQDDMPGPAEMLPEVMDNVEYVPAEMGVPELNPEGSSQIQIVPVLSEMSKSTAEPMTEGAPIMPELTIDISENSDIYVPQHIEIAEGPTSESPELSGDIFELHSDVTQTQEGGDDVFVLESEDAAFGPTAESFHFGEVEDVSDTTEHSQATETVQGINILEEEVVGPTAASESREFAVEENTLRGFGTFPAAEIADPVDVTAVLRQELGDDVAEEDQVEEVNFPVIGTGPGDIFFTDEPLQSLDNVPTPQKPDTAFGPFSGPSAVDNNEEIIAPSSTPHQDMSSFAMSDVREQDPAATDVMRPLMAQVAEIPITEVQELGMPRAAPAHIMDDMPMVENNGPGDFASAPVMMHDAPVTGPSSSGPEMLSDMPADMPMPGMGMPMQEFDSNGFHAMGDIASDTVAVTPEMEDDMMVPQLMMPGMPAGEMENVMPTDTMSQQDIMPGMPMLEGDVPMSQDTAPMPFPHDFEDNQDEVGSHDGESPFSPEVTMPSDFQTSNGPEPAFANPEFQNTESIPEGFGPLKSSSVISEGEEYESDGDMMPDMTNSATDGFQVFPENQPEEAPVPVEDHGDMTGEDATAVPESGDLMSSEDFDIRGSFGAGISEGPIEAESTEATISNEKFEGSPQPTDEVFGGNHQPPMTTESAPATDLPFEMTTQSPNEAVISDSGYSGGSPVDTPLSETDSIESRIINQAYYPEEAEDQQTLPEEPSMDAVELGDAPVEDQYSEIVDQPSMSEQPADIITEPEDMTEEAEIASGMSSATESNAEMVDMVTEQYSPPAAERDVIGEVDLQGISAEEVQEQDQESYAQYQEIQEQQQLQEDQDSFAQYQEIQEQAQLQEDQESYAQYQDQEIQEQEQLQEDQVNQASSLETREQELVRVDQQIQQQELAQEQEGEQELIQEENQEIREQEEQELVQDEELVPSENQEIQEQEEQEPIQEQDLMQENMNQQIAPTGYGPPHSDTIVDDVMDDVPTDVTADDVTEESDVIAPVTEGYMLQAYDAVPADSAQQTLV